jgi:hypothetical protein
MSLNLPKIRTSILFALLVVLSVMLFLTCKKTSNEFNDPEAAPIDVSKPDQIIGDGTPGSITAEKFIAAVAKGGKIVFNGGPDTIIIKLDRPAKIVNNAKPDVVIDGGGKVILSGNGRSRIIYMNTCDKNQVWATSHCQDQDFPRLTLQNITLVDGNSSAETEFAGGGAVWVRGGRFKAVNCRFFRNRCKDTGPDLGGGAIAVYSQYHNLPVYLVNCTFGGPNGQGNQGSNGGAISSVGVSWTIINCMFYGNKAVGNGGNPADSGTPGGGSGGAIYNDGNTMTLKIQGTTIERNEVKAFGSAIFFVTNNRTGNIIIDKSTIQNNIGGSWYPKYKGISMHAETNIQVTNSVIK